MIHGTGDMILTVIWITFQIQKFLNDLLSLHSYAILVELGFGDAVHSLSSFVSYAFKFLRYEFIISFRKYKLQLQTTCIFSVKCSDPKQNSRYCEFRNSKI